MKRYDLDDRGCLLNKMPHAKRRLLTHDLKMVSRQRKQRAIIRLPAIMASQSLDFEFSDWEPPEVVVDPTSDKSETDEILDYFLGDF